MTDINYTDSQLQNGLADARAEYRNARDVNRAYPSVDSWYNLQNAVARIRRVQTMIETHAAQSVAVLS